MDSADGLSPPSLPPGPPATSYRLILLILDFTMSASRRTNRCPEKSGAAQADMRPADARARAAALSCRGSRRHAAGDSIETEAERGGPRNPNNPGQNARTLR